MTDTVPAAATGLPTPMRGRIPASAIATTRVYPVDLVAAEPILGSARRSAALSTPPFGAAPFSTCDAAAHARAMNVVLIELSSILSSGSHEARLSFEGSPVFAAEGGAHV